MTSCPTGWRSSTASRCEPVDPHANIEEQTSLARAIVELIDDEGDDHGRLSLRVASHLADLGGQLAECVLGLDEWRRAGGFDPYG